MFNELFMKMGKIMHYISTKLNIIYILFPISHLRMCKLEKRGGGGGHDRHELTHLRILRVNLH